MDKIKVGLVGYGSQGRRIAEAIFAQKDMNFVGVCLKEADLSAHIAAMRKLPIYVTNKEDTQNFKNAKIEVKGSIFDLLPKVDVIVDATPAGIGKKNKEIFYSKHKAIFQAGEPFDVADIPCSSQKLRMKRRKK